MSPAPRRQPKSVNTRVTEKRERDRAGIKQFTIEASFDRLALALAEDGFLAEWDDHDPAAVADALNRMVAAYITSMIGADPD